MPPRILSLFFLLAALAASALATPEAVPVRNIRLGTSQFAPVPKIRVSLSGKVTVRNASGKAVSEMQNRVLFTIDDQTHGEELWSVQDQGQEPILVRDIRPGPQASWIGEMITSGSRAFFTADDGVHGRELWVTDGTETGTFLVADAVTAPDIGLEPQHLTAFPGGGGVLFQSETGGETSLWYSDGTAAGTRRLNTLGPVLEGGYADIIKTVNKIAYFLRPTPAGTTQELWKTNGTLTGTVKIRELPAGAQAWLQGSRDALLYFTMATAQNDYELWRSNGTAAGTNMLTRLVFNGSDQVRSLTMTTVGKVTFFLSHTQTGEKEIWITNGTDKGTYRLSDTPGITVPSDMACVKLMPLGADKLIAIFRETIVYSSYTTYTYHPWVYNLTTRTGEMISENGYGDTEPEFVCTDTRAFFFTGGSDLITTDGTRAGTRLIAGPEIDAREFGLVAMETGDLSPLKYVYFASDMPVGDAEVWRTDGTAENTRAVSNFKVPFLSSSPAGLTRTRRGLFFTADDGVGGRELWVTDGTSTDTALVKDLHPGPESSNPADMIEMDGCLYFTATDGSTVSPGRKLWRTDLTTFHTAVVKEIHPGSYSNVRELAVFAGRLYFSATSNVGQEVWCSDGTEAGTVLFANLKPDVSGSISSHPAQFTPVGSWLYFTAQTTTVGRSLCRTQGTPGSTVVVATFTDVIILGAQPTTGLYFTALPEGETAPTLWKCQSDGAPVRLGGLDAVTSAEMTRLKVHFFSADSDLAFVSKTVSAGISTRIWKVSSDQPPITQLLPDERPRMLRLTGQKLYYEVRPPGFPWSGLKCLDILTGQIQELIPAASGIQVAAMGSEGDTFYFTHTRPGERPTLWETRGSPATTRELSPVPLDPSGTDDAELPDLALRYGNRLIFPANDGLTGVEPYSLDISPRLEADVILPDSPPQSLPLTAAGVLDFGPQTLLQPRVRTLTLRNAGSLPLTQIQLALPAQTEYTVILGTGDLGALAAGEEKQIQITFTPQIGGLREATLQIRALTEIGEELVTTLDHDLRLTGTGVATQAQTGFGHLPLLRLVMTGTTVTLAPEIGIAQQSAPLIYLWRQGSLIVGSSPVLTLPAVTATAAGSYHLSIGSTFLSPISRLAVIAPLPAITAAAQDRPATLTCTVTAPSDCLVQYQWLRDGHPVPEMDRTRGSQTSALKIDRVQPWDPGFYSCLVTLSDGLQQVRLETNSTELTLTPPPTVQPPSQPLAHYVGETVDVQMQAEPAVSGFTVKGLPPGLKMSPSGRVTGRPTKASPIDPATGLPRPYTVTLTASNIAGASQATLLPWIIHPILTPGTYEGLFDRDGSLDNGKALGSRVRFTVATTGALSGQLQHAGKTHPFTATAAIVQGTWPQARFRAEISISRGKTLPALILTLHSDEVTGSYQQMSLALPAGEAVPGILRKHLFSTREPAGALARYYTLGLLPEAEHDSQPRGSGFLSATVSKTGISTWKGRLPDGTAITGSSALASADPTDAIAFPLRQELYKGLGSVQGWIGGPHMRNIPAGSRITMEGNLDLNKAALPADSKERNCKDGFALLPIEVIGSHYEPPAKDELLWNLTSLTDNTRARLFGSVADFGEEGLSQRLTLTAKHTALLPPLSAITPLKTLTLNAKTGTFKGTLVLPHTDPALVRTVSFEGMLLLNTTSVGHFLLPDLPAPGQPASALKTTPLRSCGLSLTPVMP